MKVLGVNLFGKKPATATDPVCKMDVDISNPPGGKHEHKGTTYYFCSPGCRVSFSKDPEKFLASKEAHPMGHA
jgi:Cu+-exporting ATPase